MSTPEADKPRDEDPADSSGRLSREEVFSWLSGPRAAGERAGIEYGYRGERLGFPAEGTGSVASFGRRLVAMFLDWVAALLIARVIEAQLLEPTAATSTLLVPLVFFLEIALLTMVGGASFGQGLMRIRVAALGGGRASPLRVLARTFLLCLAVPALIWDRDGRGLHDRAANSVVLDR